MLSAEGFEEAGSFGPIRGSLRKGVNGDVTTLSELPHSGFFIVCVCVCVQGGCSRGFRPRALEDDNV